MYFNENEWITQNEASYKVMDMNDAFSSYYSTVDLIDEGSSNMLKVDAMCTVHT